MTDTTDTPKMSYEKIARVKTDLVLGVLSSIAAGPREAYGILCICIHQLNFEISDEKADIDQLCAEVAITLRSITPVQKADLQ
jgi:hypothetical protein